MVVHAVCFISSSSPVLERRGRIVQCYISSVLSESGNEITASASNKLDNDGYCNDASWTQQFRTTFSFSTSTSTVDRSLQRMQTAVSPCLFLFLFLCPYMCLTQYCARWPLSLPMWMCECVSANERDTTDHTPLSLFDICFVAWSYVPIAWASSAGTHAHTQCSALGVCVYVRCINSIVHFVS